MKKLGAQFHAVEELPGPCSFFAFTVVKIGRRARHSQRSRANGKIYGINGFRNKSFKGILQNLPPKPLGPWLAIATSSQSYICFVLNI